MTATAPSSVTVRPAGGLSGTLRLPGDKSISHRALMLALLAEGTSRIRGASDGADVRSTAGIAEALGANVVRTVGAAGNVDYVVSSPGADGLRQPDVPLECGNSGTSLRLFAGILAGQRMRAILDGDASLRRRPMARIIEPLRAMGAWLEGMGAGTPPLIVIGQQPLSAVDWKTQVPSAQVKSAILLAGLAAEGTTSVREPVATRDHTERMLRARGVDVTTTAAESGGSVVQVAGPAGVRPVDERVAGDVSAAAFWLVAGAIHPVASILLEDVNDNPTRTAVIDILDRMGAEISRRETSAEALDPNQALNETSEPTSEMKTSSSALVATEISATESAAVIDEIPVLCLAATQARARTVIRGAGELRHKESDRFAGIVAGLSSLGARIEAVGDDIVIEGPTALRGAVVDSLGDHRLAMTFAIAGLIATGSTTILDAGSVGISYPSFFADLERIRT